MLKQNFQVRYEGFSPGKAGHLLVGSFTRASSKNSSRLSKLLKENNPNLQRTSGHFAAVPLLKQIVVFQIF